MKHRPDYAALVLEYERGGLTQRAFCAKQRINFSTFKYWLARVRRQKQSESGFLPLQVIASKSGAELSASVEIVYPDGIILKLNRATAEDVRQFLPVFAL